jgi:zinc transporter ZupT
VLLAVFAGFFLYIGASELLPRAHAQGRPTLIVTATLAGLLFIWTVVRVAGG